MPRKRVGYASVAEANGHRPEDRFAGLAELALTPATLALIEQKKGIFLDVGCSDHKSLGSIGIDKRQVAGVDIVHDIEVLPWPLPDACCYRILMSHIVEHLKPWLIMDIIDEAWRVMLPEGQLLIATPYAGSPRFHQDPTHIHGWMEATALYFTPDYPELYNVYRPKPWKVLTNLWNSIGDMHIQLQKLEEVEV